MYAPYWLEPIGFAEFAPAPREDPADVNRQIIQK
jgi:hypothetical protein